jgi:NAD+ synthase
MQTIRESLKIDPASETVRICDRVRTQVSDDLKRRGAVVAMSGGIDSSVSAALAARALGPERVFGLMMPERDGGAGDEGLATRWARTLGISYAVEPIGPVLEALGCYARRDEAIRRVVPGYGEGWRSKIGLSDGDAPAGLVGIVYYLTVQSPDGTTTKVRLPGDALRQIMAATNFKQRVRKTFDYYHADRLHYAVIGTPNRLEYDQGFFVKGGDGLADVKPIAHLYKSQVYQLAEFLGVPQEIRGQTSTTATYSLPQTQEEFYFSLPLLDFDLALAGYDRGLPPEAVAEEVGLPPSRLTAVYRDIERRRETARYLHHAPAPLDQTEPLD